MTETEPKAEVTKKPEKIEVDTSDLVITSDKRRFIRARRYSLRHSVQHWGNMILMLLFFFTGLEIARIITVIDNPKFTTDFHIILGFIILFWSVFLYVFLIYWDKKLYEVIPTPRDLLDLALIVGCALGILDDKHYPHYDFYDPIRKKYVMKYHPVQKLLAFFNFWALMFIGITGFALYEQLSPGKYWIAELSFVLMEPVIELIGEIGLSIRIVHFFLFIYFGLSTTIHAYFALKKNNRSRLVAMVKGYENIELDKVPPIDVSNLERYYEVPIEDVPAKEE